MLYILLLYCTIFFPEVFYNLASSSVVKERTGLCGSWGVTVISFSYIIELILQMYMQDN